MSVFITGGTGYLGSYVVDELLRDPRAGRLFLMTRTAGDEGIDKLWKALQLHMDADAFYAALHRIVLVEGDLHAPGLGLREAAWSQITEECDSVLHIAASLNRKSDKACFNANLRGMLSVIQRTRALAEARGGLRRFSSVSTTAVSGKREHECVGEDEAIDWDRSDYDPYARTKKFGEHMIRELLPDVKKTIFRPPTVMGDARFAATTQFEMVRIYSLMVSAPMIPVHPDTRLDFVPASFVGPAIAKLHMKDDVRWDCYHLSAGAGSKTARQHADALSRAGFRTPRLEPRLHGAFDFVASQLSNGPRGSLSSIGALLQVFLPYFTNDVVFDNTRVVAELGDGPPPFTDYAAELLRYAREVGFRYPYAPLPSSVGRAAREAAE